MSEITFNIKAKDDLVLKVSPNGIDSWDELEIVASDTSVWLCVFTDSQPRPYSLSLSKKYGNTETLIGNIKYNIPFRVILPSSGYLIFEATWTYQNQTKKLNNVSVNI